MTTNGGPPSGKGLVTGAGASASATATTAVNVNANEGIADVLEERLIDAEYKIWKKNTPYLYDFVMTHSLEWPSLTCQWLPTVRKQTNTTSTPGTTPGTSAANGAATGSATASSSTSEYSLLLGTHTTEEQNYLMVATCYVPSCSTSEHPTDEEQLQQQRQQQNVNSTTANNNEDAENKDPATGNNSNNKISKHKTSDSPASVTAVGNGSLPASSVQYDEEKNEIGGFGHNLSNQGKVDIRMKVKHEGEVNRARYMPQNHFIVATRGPNPELYIWDLSKHPSFPTDKSTFCPQGVCTGHTQEGYGLVWSKHREGYLLSASEDTNLCLWDIASIYSSQSSVVNTYGGTVNSNGGAQITPVCKFTGHTSVVEDVDWHHHDTNLVGSVGDDRTIRLWDIREKGTKPLHTVVNAHKGDVNCIAFNPVNEHVFATGSADKNVALWDIRNLKSRTHLLSGHTDQVYMVEWAPFNESILGSCSADRRVGIWDLSRIGMEQTPDDAEDGPPELLFLHGGHCSKVSDFCWNPKYEWTMASVSEDNILQVWNIAEEIYAPDDDDDEDEDDNIEDEVDDDDDDDDQMEDDDEEDDANEKDDETKQNDVKDKQVDEKVAATDNSNTKGDMMIVDGEDKNDDQDDVAMINKSGNDNSDSKKLDINQAKVGNASDNAVNTAIEEDDDANHPNKKTKIAPTTGPEATATETTAAEATPKEAAATPAVEDATATASAASTGVNQ